VLQGTGLVDTTGGMWGTSQHEEWLAQGEEFVDPLLLCWGVLKEAFTMS